MYDDLKPILQQATPLTFAVATTSSLRIGSKNTVCFLLFKKKYEYTPVLAQRKPTTTPKHHDLVFFICSNTFVAYRSFPKSKLELPFVGL